MSRVLFLAYHFPPIGGAGVQRSAKFVRYLPELGCDPLVVTGPGPAVDDQWTPTDTSLGRELPPELPVVRVDRPRPRASTGARARAERWLGVPTPFARWWIDGAVEASHEVPEVDLVYASLSPYESAEAAARIASERGRPWVADLRDPWALDEMRVYVTGLHRRLDLRRMHSSLASAAAIVMNTPEAARRLVDAFPDFARKLVVAIPNGYDATDFDVAPAPRDDATFRIVHTGYLHTELGRDERRRARARRLLGGSTTGVDILTRSHVFLLEAVERLRREESALPVELHLAGVASPGDRAAARSDAVQFRGYLPHAETLALVRSADLLFLPMQELPRGVRATIVPGKTYEYLGSGRPILAAVPDGDARDLLARVPQAHLCRPADVEGMTEIIRELVRRKRSDGAQPDARAEVVLDYERRHLTDALASVFARVLGHAHVSEGSSGSAAHVV